MGSSEFDLGGMAMRIEALERRMDRHEDFAAKRFDALLLDVNASNKLLQRAYGAVMFVGALAGAGFLTALFNAVMHGHGVGS